MFHAPKFDQTGADCHSNHCGRGSRLTRRHKQAGCPSNYNAHDKTRLYTASLPRVCHVPKQLQTTPLHAPVQPGPLPNRSAPMIFLDKCFDEYVATHPQIENVTQDQDDKRPVDDISMKRPSRSGNPAENLAELKASFRRELDNRPRQLRYLRVPGRRDTRASSIGSTVIR